MDKIEIVPLVVEIKTITLNGKKLTKSIFNQIEFRDCFDVDIDFIGDQFFGYIKDKDQRYLLWSYAGDLYKTNLSKYSKLPKVDSEYTSVNLGWFLKNCNINYVSDERQGIYKFEMDRAGTNTYNALVLKAKSFINDVLNHQLFI